MDFKSFITEHVYVALAATVVVTIFVVLVVHDARQRPQVFLMRAGALLGIAVAAGIVYYGSRRNDLPIILIGVGVLAMAIVGSMISAHVHSHGKKELAKASGRLKELEGKLKLAETQPLAVHIHKPVK